MANEDDKYVTKLELIKTQKKIEDKVYGKIEDVDRKVDTLNDIVLPLVESSKQTAANTERMVKSFDGFANEQRKTNGKFYDRLHDHELTINKLGQKTESQIEEKKANATITVAVIAAAAGLLTAIFNLAPLIFN